MNKILLSLLLLLPAISYAQLLKVNLINCKISEREHSKLEKLIAYQRMFYNELFDTDVNLETEVKINLYGRSRDFKAAVDLYKVYKQVDGFYLSDLNEAFVLKNNDFISICLHESSHSLFATNIKFAPRWLNEGMAEFFETLDFNENGELYASPQTERLKSINAGIALRDSTRLKTFFNINNSKFYAEKSTDNYSTAYSIIYYFIKSKNSAALKNIIRLIKEGLDTETAFTKTYGSFNAFEEGYNRFYYYNRK